MRGDLLRVWPETWTEIWYPVLRHEDAPEDIAVELFDTLVPQPVAPKEPSRPEDFTEAGDFADPADRDAFAAYDAAFKAYEVALGEYQEAANDPGLAEIALKEFLTQPVLSELHAVKKIEEGNSTIAAFELESLNAYYFERTKKFLEKYNLRYTVRQPFSLHVTPSGVLVNIIQEIEKISQGDEGLQGLVRDYNEAFEDLKLGHTPGRIRTCIQKQVNLLEGIGTLNREINGGLGEICTKIENWPHPTIPKAIIALYGLASDVQGIRHGVRNKKKLPETNLRDLVALSAMFCGAAVYLDDDLDPARIYFG